MKRLPPGATIGLVASLVLALALPGCSGASGTGANPTLGTASVGAPTASTLASPTPTPMTTATPQTVISGHFTEFPIPTANGEPTGIALAPDGDIFFSETFSNQIGRISPTGTVTEYPLPSNLRGPWGMVAGPDGAMWFSVDANGPDAEIGRITTSGTVTAYPISQAPNVGSWGIAEGPDGALWFTEFANGKIGRMSTSGQVTQFALPGTGQFPGGITAGPDGALWFTATQDPGEIGRISVSGQITEFPIPTPNSGPAYITTGPDGALWFTQSVSNTIGRVTTDGAVTEYPYQLRTVILKELARDPMGRCGSPKVALPGKIGRITTAGVISECPTPSPDSVPGFILTGPDHALWFTESGTPGKIVGGLTEDPLWSQDGPLEGQIADEIPARRGWSRSVLVRPALPPSSADRNRRIHERSPQQASRGLPVVVEGVGRHIEPSIQGMRR